MTKTLNQWFRIEEKDIGTRFVTLKACSLDRLVHIGSSAWRGETKDLPVGAVLIYKGMKMGWGSDNILLPNFEEPDSGFSGELGPLPFDGWGSIPVGLIEKGGEISESNN